MKPLVRVRQRYVLSTERPRWRNSPLPSPHTKAALADPACACPPWTTQPPASARSSSSAATPQLSIDGCTQHIAGCTTHCRVACRWREHNRHVHEGASPSSRARDVPDLSPASSPRSAPPSLAGYSSPPCSPPLRLQMGDRDARSPPLGEGVCVCSAGSQHQAAQWHGARDRNRDSWHVAARACCGLGGTAGTMDAVAVAGAWWSCDLPDRLFSHKRVVGVKAGDVSAWRRRGGPRVGAAVAAVAAVAVAEDPRHASLPLCVPCSAVTRDVAVYAAMAAYETLGLALGDQGATARRGGGGIGDNWRRRAAMSAWKGRWRASAAHRARQRRSR